VALFAGFSPRSRLGLQPAFRPISANFRWDRAKESAFWPDLPSGWLLLAEQAALSQSGGDDPHRSRPGAHLLLDQGRAKPGAVESAATT